MILNLFHRSPSLRENDSNPLSKEPRVQISCEVILLFEISLLRTVVR